MGRTKVQQKKYNKEYYQKNREKEKERTKKYRQENPEKVKQSCINWRENNPDKRRNANLRYKEKNREKLRLKAKEYYESNRDKILETEKPRSRKRRYNYRKEWLEIIENDILEEKACCLLCGYDNYTGLEFHHFEFANKDFNVSTFTAKKPTPERIEILAEELKKGTFLCVLCHREIHFGEIRTKLGFEITRENLDRLHLLVDSLMEIYLKRHRELTIQEKKNEQKGE